MYRPVSQPFSSNRPNSFKFVFSVYLIVLSIESNSCQKVYNLSETAIDNLNVQDRRVIICKIPQEKQWINLFAKSYLKFNDVNAIKNIYTGYDLVETKEQMSKWLNYNYLRLFINSSTVKLPLYSEYCVGIESSSSYQLSHHFNTFDLYNFTLFLLGVTLFCSSNYLSKKIYIYYVTHMTLGVIGSLLILTIVMHRFLPRRLYAFFVLSSFYLNTYFVVKIKEYLFSYPMNLYLGCYILVAGIVSFAFAYYKGPIKNHRLYDLFKWFLQFISLLIIFVSSELSELIFLIMVLILLKYNSPLIFKILNDLNKFYRFYFPKPIQFISKKECERLVRLTTDKELEKLRSYCKSPEFNKWKAMKKMHNASRFAGFIDGEDDVSDSEVFEHKSYVNLSESQWTDDSSDESIGLDD